MDSFGAVQIEYWNSLQIFTSNESALESAFTRDAKSSKLEHMFTFAIHFTNIDLLSSNVKESLKKERGGARVCLVD